MQDKIDLTQMANIVASEAELLHCTLGEAWESISGNLTRQFNYEEVESLIIELYSQSNHIAN